MIMMIMIMKFLLMMILKYFTWPLQQKQLSSSSLSRKHFRFDSNNCSNKFNFINLIVLLFLLEPIYWNKVDAGEECCNTGKIYSDRNECHLIPNINHVEPDRILCLLETTFCCLQYSRENFCSKIGQEFMKTRSIQDYLESIVQKRQNNQNGTLQIDSSKFWRMLRSRYQCYSYEDKKTFCCVGCTLGFAMALQKLAQWDQNKITEKLIKSNLSEWCSNNDAMNSGIGSFMGNSFFIDGMNNSATSTTMMMGNAAYNVCCRETIKAINSSVKWCDLRPAPCAHHCHEAKRGSSQIHCSCWEGYRLAPDGRNCIDVDECQERTHDCNDVDEFCFNTDGKYQCLPKMTDDSRTIPGLEITGNRNECLPGFYFNRTEDRCKDIDECWQSNHRCDLGRQVCVNKLGSYDCLSVGLSGCPKGFRRLAPSNEYDTGCRDIDECQEGQNNCDYLNEICENFIGSFTCESKININRTIRLISSNLNETMMMNDLGMMSWSGISSEGDSFMNTVGSSCPKGYHFVKLSYKCEDINECLIGQHNCDLSVDVCVNLPGTYVCRSDINNETVENTTTPAAIAVPLFGDRNLGKENNEEHENKDENTILDAIKCQDGFGLNPVLNICEDIDECRRTRSPCPSNSLCQNTLGSYVCHCKSGFTKSFNGKCEDVDECDQELSNCPSTMRCINTLGSFECIPTFPSETASSSGPTRFSYNTGRCQKGQIFDEIKRECIGKEKQTSSSINKEKLKCKFGERIINGECKRVVCSQGFFYNETDKRCQDMNECLEYSPCLKQEKCTNTIGSYRCSRRCGQGYQLASNGISCEDIDECSLGTFHCPAGKICQNRRGSYSCECPPGFMAGRDGQCQDIDECDNNGDELMCDVSGTQSCINTVGSYRCECKRGYREHHRSRNIDNRNRPNNRSTVKTGLTCVDVDECKDPHLNNCQHYCLNYVGSYKCSCRSGYKLNNDGHTCEDEDECQMFQTNLIDDNHDRGSSSSSLKSSLCYYKCLNTPGSFRCVCPPGYESLNDGAICRDIDECEVNDHENICEDNEFCLNVKGSYRCVSIQCPKGYFFEMKNKKCLRHHEGVMGFRDLSKPISYSYNYLSIVSNIRIPKSLEYFDLVAINGKIFEIPDIRYNLTLNKALPGRPGVQLAKREDFILRKPRYDQIVVSLMKPLFGPQDVDLELTISLYPEDKFSGMSKALIYIVVSEYDF